MIRTIIAKHKLIWNYITLKELLEMPLIKSTKILFGSRFSSDSVFLVFDFSVLEV